MNIAFLAHDKKKELMVQFCTAYKSVLMKHNLFATATTGRLIADNTGLPITLALIRSRLHTSPGAVSYNVVITPVTPGICRICLSVTVSNLLPYHLSVISIILIPSLFLLLLLYSNRDKVPLPELLYALQNLRSYASMIDK